MKLSKYGSNMIIPRSVSHKATSSMKHISEFLHGILGQTIKKRVIESNLGVTKACIRYFLIRDMFLR